MKQAIEGVGNLRIGQWQQQMVPIKEMTDVLKVVKETANLKPKQWVRLKRGVFKDDLAQIDYVEPSQNMVHVKLIPRVDYTKPRGVLRGQREVGQESCLMINSTVCCSVSLSLTITWQLLTANTLCLLV